MSQSKLKLKRRARFLTENKLCCFCGGVAPSTTWDHVPPRACFPRGLHPENYEFPACLECNQGTRKADLIFGFYTSMLDHDDNNYSRADLQRLIGGMCNNYPEALPKMDLTARVKRNFLRKIGAVKPAGLAFKEVPLVAVPSIFGDAAFVSMRKLACALYYKEVGRCMTLGQQIMGGWNQIQNPQSRTLTEYFNSHMSAYRQPARSTIKDYGSRFVYKFAYNEEEDFFGYAAQFGLGIFLWCIAARPEMDTSDGVMPIFRVGEPWLM